MKKLLICILFLAGCEAQKHPAKFNYGDVVYQKNNDQHLIIVNRRFYNGWIYNLMREDINFEENEDNIVLLEKHDWNKEFLEIPKISTNE